MLFGLAVIAALLPLASIITPATLTIVQRQITPPRTSQLYVPNVDFSSLNYVQAMTPPPIAASPIWPPEYYYNGPSSTVTEIVQAVAVQGSIAAITPPAVNTTWSVEFAGPVLTCQNVSAPQSYAIISNIADANLNNTLPNNCRAYGFIAWMATGSNESSILPFKSTGNGTYTLPSYNGLTYGTPAVLFMAAMPDVMTVVDYGDHSLTLFCEDQDTVRQIDLAKLAENSTFIECEMVNASYAVSFDYRNASQAIEVNTSIIDIGGPLLPVSSVFGPSNLGWSGLAPADYSNGVPTPHINTELLQMLSYQAIMDAFVSSVTGSISVGLNVVEPTIDTNILLTSLVQAPDLVFLTQPNVKSGDSAYSSLQNAVTVSNMTTLNSLLNNLTIPQNSSLGTMMEELFRNIVVSMMSAPQLQPNYTSPFAPPKAVVTTYSEQNFYVYNAARLWTAYGLAIAFTTYTICIGLLAIFTNKGTYGSDFSTIFRIVHGGTLSIDMTNENTEARGPLPKTLANATVCVAESGRTATRTTDAARAKDDSSIMLLDQVHHVET